MNNSDMNTRINWRRLKLRSVALWLVIGTAACLLFVKVDWQNLIELDVKGQQLVLLHLNAKNSSSSHYLKTTTVRISTKNRIAHLHENGLNTSGVPSPGRQRNDGAWYSMKGPVELYVYTAHYDDRSSVQIRPIVRVVAVSELNKNQQVFCVVWFHPERRITIPAWIVEVGAGVYRHDKLFIELIISCPLADMKVPTHVSIIQSHNDSPSFAVPVEMGFKMDGKQQIGICVSVSYWYHEPSRLIEWIEFQRLMGVDGIIIYNNSLAIQSQKVFSYYASHDPDFLELRQTRNFIRDGGEFTLHLQMSPVINDCIYRYRKRFNVILVIDLDELLVPNYGENFKEMIDRIEEIYTTPHVPYAYTFRNAYFFMDFGPRLDQPEELISLRYTQRADYSEPGYSSKSMVGTNACVAMHNHFCWLYTEELLNSDILPYIDVDTDIASLHHYKYCHFGSTECEELFAGETEDSRMLRFREPLINAVNAQRNVMGMPQL